VENGLLFSMPAHRDAISTARTPGRDARAQLMSQLDALFKRLSLANTSRMYPKLIERAETLQWSYHDLLATLAREELAFRQQTRIKRLLAKARLPFFKTIDDFDFTCQSTLRLAMLGSALSPDFITQGSCLIFSGKPGRGKTHLAVAIAYRAIQNGFDALFVTAAELIDQLSAAFRQGSLAAALAPYVSPDLLIVDEVGYLTYSSDAANMLFHVVNTRHRHCRSMVFTTNKPLNQWGEVLHDHDLAHAIVDRILERGRQMALDGPSMRTRHLGLEDPFAKPQETDQQILRISGKSFSEFPEPTKPGACWVAAFGLGCKCRSKSAAAVAGGNGGRKVRHLHLMIGGGSLTRTLKRQSPANYLQITCMGFAQGLQGTATPWLDC
jgi:DNA replication protein DnaC